MAHFLAGYLAITGAISAGLQVARGVVRGVGRLIEGDPRGAVVEVAGGLVAPVRTVYNEACKLGADVFAVAGGIADDSDSSQEFAPPRTQGHSPDLPGELDGVMSRGQIGQNTAI